MENKIATYEVTTMSGRTRTLMFTEYLPKDNNHYGNGIYILVERSDSEEFYIDCRYDRNYNFEKNCEEWIKSYYGYNLSAYKKV